MMEQSASVGTITVVAQKAVNVALGWIPRYVRAVNVNNLAFYEYFDGMTAGTSLDTTDDANGARVSVNAADGISEYAGRAPGGSITGTGAVTAASTAVTGTSTNFIGELVVGDLITINGETRKVITITNATAIVVDEAFVATATGATIYDVTGKPAGFTLGTDICDTGSDVVRWLAIR